MMKIIEKELEQVLTEIKEGFTDPTPQETLTNFVLKGSKYTRSTLGILYLKAQEIELNPLAFRILASGELIHNASLLHDDVIDEADKRRGETTIAKKFSSKISILVGDYLISSVIEKLLNCDTEILSIFKNCTKKMAEAEIKQFFLRGKLPTIEEYIEICENKTALLFASILESLAIALNIDRDIAKSLGMLFGTCFQIKNDLNTDSAQIDKKNNIFTAKDVLGIEKTLNLLDNYKKEMRELLGEFPNNIYKKTLEDLINSL